MLLSKDDILSKSLRTKEVDVPEWGGTVKVRELTSAELKAVTGFWKSDDASIEAQVRIVRMALVDDEGNQVFTEAEETELAQRSATAITRIFKEIDAFLKLDEGTAKNSGGAPTDSGSST